MIVEALATVFALNIIPRYFSVGVARNIIINHNTIGRNQEYTIQMLSTCFQIQSLKNTCTHTSFGPWAIIGSLKAVPVVPMGNMKMPLPMPRDSELLFNSSDIQTNAMQR